jgi:hypothetical protein
MGGPEFAAEIRKAWRVFESDLKIGRMFTCATSLPIDNAFRDIVHTPDSLYRDIYRVGLSRSAYNFLLEDYSYFQFSWENEAAWRLAYYPNPWIAGVPGALALLKELEELEQSETLGSEDLDLLLDEFDYHSAVPPVRFEYSSQQYREIVHPAAHFHVGRNGDNRWPCALRLGPQAFSMMIARLYYSDRWNAKSNFAGQNVNPCIDATFLEVIQMCQVVYQFSEVERRGLHLGKNLIQEHEGNIPRKSKNKTTGIRTTKKGL